MIQKLIPTLRFLLLRAFWWMSSWPAVTSMWARSLRRIATQVPTNPWDAQKNSFMPKWPAAKALRAGDVLFETLHGRFCWGVCWWFFKVWECLRYVKQLSAIQNSRASTAASNLHLYYLIISYMSRSIHDPHGDCSTLAHERSQSTESGVSAANGLMNYTA